MNEWEKINFKMKDIAGKLPKEALKESYMSSEERKEFINRFCEENECVAKQYLRREDGKLFYQYDETLERNVMPLTVSEKKVLYLLLSMYADKTAENRFLDGRIQILEKRSKGKRIVYFGAGQRCIELFEKGLKDVDFIVDNAYEKEGTQINGVCIRHASNVGNWDECFIIITCEEAKEIEEQLKKYRLQKGENYILAKDCFY